MKMEDKRTLAPAPTAAPQVYQQLGLLTRQVHDALAELGLNPGLLRAAQGLPEARSRLDFISAKTAEAADRVLDAVDRARTEQRQIGAAAARLSLLAAAPGAATVAALVSEVQAASSRLDAHLLDIMVAQDYHDLTGQVVVKVMSLASELEEGLLKLLLLAAPPGAAPAAAAPALGGPVLKPGTRGDVASNQGEVDELLASLGF